MSEFWSMWIVIITITTLLVGYGLIWWLDNQDEKMHVDCIDWGDIRAHTHSIPRWWLYLFNITIIFVIVYVILYPALGSLPGKLQWTSQHQYVQEHGQYHAQDVAQLNQYLSRPVTVVAQDANARQIGKQLFSAYCSNCHSSVLKKDSIHYPHLSDHDWLWGGKPEQIKETITKGRTGIMPAWGTILGENGSTEMVNYVMAIAGRQPLDKEKVVAGKEKFALYCHFCHGHDGQGDIRVGAPNLTDQIWLHLTSQEAATDVGLAAGITKVINNGFNNSMPPHWQMLDPAKIHLLTSYIYGLSN